MRRLRRRVRGLPISARLGALVLVPLLGLTSFGASLAVDGWQEARAARTMRDQAQLVAVLSVSSSQLEQELDSLEGIVEAQSFGVEFDTISNVLGYDFLGSLSTSQADSDAAFVALASIESQYWAAPEAIAEIIAFEDSLRELRARLAAGQLDRPLLVQLTSGVREALETAVDAQNDELSDARDQVAVSPQLSALLDSAEYAESVATAARHDRRALAAYLLPALDETHASDRIRRDRFVVAAHEFDETLQALERVGVAHVSDGLGDAGAAEDRSAFEDLRERALADEVVPFDNYDDFASVSQVGFVLFVPGFNRIDHYAALSVDSARLVSERSSEVEERAAAGFLASVVLSAGLALGTGLLGLVIFRSIVVPLRRLEARAQAITEGNLDEPERRDGGPEDLRLIDEAMDRMTADLTTLSRQTEALAAGRLDDEILEQQVIGPIGASVHGSLNRLLRMTARLEYEATHDRLTGLPNRSALLSLLDRCLTGGVDDRVPLAAVMLDLDGFKGANDVLGHPVGDEILVAVARRLESVTGQAFVARLGGDEFMAVIIGDVDDDLLAASADRLARALVAALHDPMATSCGPVPISACGGVVVTTTDNWLAPSEVLRRVDLALYQAKSQGAAQVVVFDQVLHDSLLHSARIQGEVRRALSNDEFELHLQAVVDTETHLVGGFEALLRWQPEEGDPVAPGIFIPVAEQTDLIIDIDRWVLERGAELLGQWALDPATRHFSLSINISGRHVSSPELVDAVAAAVQRHGFEPSRLIIEVTESQIIPSLDRAEHVLRSLADLGVKLAIDDFGTGYASVAHLRHIRFDRLKIDRTFLLALEDETERSLANLLVSLGRDLRLDVVAEGVETQEQVDWAEAAGCTHLQGFRFSRPAPPEEALRLASRTPVPQSPV